MLSRHALLFLETPGKKVGHLYHLYVAITAYLFAAGSAQGLPCLWWLYSDPMRCLCMRSLVDFGSCTIRVLDDLLTLYALSSPVYVLGPRNNSVT